jgi:hypothetical protein
MCLVGAAVWGWPADQELPGMALGSPVVLVAERTAVLFAVWLSGITVATEAWRGRLPVEVSGRGVKYAEAATGQAMVEQTESALRRHDTDIEALRREIADLASRA